MATIVKRDVGAPKVVEVTNVGTAKASGKLIVVGEMICCHLHDQGISATGCAVYIGGVEIEYTKLTTDVVTEGLKLYFDATNDRLTTTASTHKVAGLAAAAAGSTATTARLLLGEIRA